MTIKFLIFISICGIYLKRATADCNNVYPGTPTFMDNRYRCHCKNDAQCDHQTGSCSRGCDFGWMGPGCQYRNIAKYMKTVRAIGNNLVSAEYATKAVDGDIQTCSKSNPNRNAGLQWWRIEWDRDYLVTGLVLKLPLDNLENFRSFRVETGTGPTNSDFGRICYQHTNSPGSVEMEIMCEQSVRARHLRVILPIPDVPLRLCEVEIYGGRQTSFNMETDQSSTYQQFHSFRSVDGHDLSQYSGISKNLESLTRSTCSATAGNERNPWWYVNLGNIFDIQDIYFFGRRNLETQFESYTLSIGNSSELTKEIFQDDGVGNATHAYQPKETQLQNVERGQFLKVERKLHEDGLLAICEVHAFADCPVNKCGWNCSLPCYCQGDATGTVKIDGLCPSGCLSGWTGNGGKCDIGCWGDECENECGNCLEQPCNTGNGECSGGCNGPWYPPLCILECANGTYGLNCSGRCGYCFGGGTCDHVTGYCPDRCAAGYVGNMCTDECSNGTYGLNCSNRCGNCLNNAACNPVNGICETGCQEGWRGDSCVEAISEGSQHEAQGPSFAVGVIVGVVSAIGFVGLAGALRWIIILQRRKTKKTDKNVYSSPSYDCNGTSPYSPNYDVLDHSHTNQDLGIYYNSEVYVHQSENDTG